MLTFVRKYLLESDFSGICKRLLKYPPVEDISIITDMGVSYMEYLLSGCLTSRPSLKPKGELVRRSVNIASPNIKKFRKRKAN
mmetsp:Transcript_8623/g.1189  ORF Transcript_8623/g.1189 Transcript_8623/m.1189 type:complete len:83 (-) Transcript_8623:161-409(-)